MSTTVARLGEAGIAVSGAAAAAVACATALRGLSPWPSGTAHAVLGLAAGSGVLAVALVLVDRPALRAAGALGAAASVSWFASSWNDPLVGSGALFTLGIVLGPVAPVLLGHTVLRTSGRSRSAERPVLLVAYVCALGVAGAGTAFFLDPRAGGCFRSPDNMLEVDNAPTVVSASTHAAAPLTACWAVGLGVCLAVRLAGLGSARQRVVGPAFVSATAYLVVVAAASVHASTRVGVGPDAVDERLWTCQAALLCVVALTAAWPPLRLRRTRLRLARAVALTGTLPQDGGVSAALGKALGDPSLRLLYPRADGRLLDVTGRPRGWQSDASSLTWLTRRSSRLAVLHRRGALDRVELVDLLPRAVGVAIDEELLLVEREDHLTQLEESRRRIVAEADRVRRNLERDLHDGAQQHLVTLALSLRLTQLQSTAPSPALAEAEAIVIRALEELREVAHGVHPSELTQEGLVVALENYAEGADAPVELRIDVHRRLPATVESAAYFAVVQGLRGAHPDAVAFVDVVERDDRLHLVVQYAGASTPAAQLRIEDRVAAGGGNCVSRTHAGLTRLEVTLPCAW